jgi:hypothetical protein
MGWDVDTGLPSVDRLHSLGLEDVAEDLQKNGVL